ncbi:MAG TPA: acyloxyacyl hydrolase [Piscirickettsiaceae bacterium]|nr:acyloxyacyl hydrolase [Piscirickettsiaceae bacterium]
MVEYIKNRLTKYMKQIIKILTTVLVLTLLSSGANADKIKDNWKILVGSGQSHVGWGGTKETVKTYDFIFQHETIKSSAENSKYRKSFLFEVPIHIVRAPYSSYMTGINVYHKWQITSNDKLQPYALIGGGGLYTNADIPGTSSKIRGTYGAGLGLQLNINKDFKYSIETRFHHVSNGSIKSPNDPLNSHKVLIGFDIKI